jgi:hypothetical protein
MRPWAIVCAALAAFAVLFLIGSGADGRDESGRAKEGVDERGAQVLSAAPVLTGPAPAITLVLENPHTPADAATLISEARDLVTAADGQPPDQAKQSLEQAKAKLHDAEKMIEKAADDTSNFVTRLRLVRLDRALEAVQARLALKVKQL